MPEPEMSDQPRTVEEAISVKEARALIASALGICREPCLCCRATAFNLDNLIATVRSECAARERQDEDEDKPKTYDLLVLPPQDKPVYFIVERPDNADYNQTDDQRRFLYESHSCPTNWLKPIFMSHDGDNDPHGLIRYAANKKESELPPDEMVEPNDRTRAFDEWIESIDLTSLGRDPRTE